MIHQKMNNNVRYNIMAMKTLKKETKIPQIWKDFVEYHVSDAFYQVNHPRFAGFQPIIYARCVIVPG